MRKVILKIHTSLNGYIRANDDSPMDWIFSTYDEKLREWEVDLLWQVGIHIMGKNLYDEMAAYWPGSTEVYASPMNEIPKVVFSKSLKKADWKETKIASGDLSQEIYQLKKEPGKDILVHGGAAFVQSLSKLGLIDEYKLVVHPVFLSGGLPLFKERLKLKLSDTKSFPAGAILLTYESN